MRKAHTTAMSNYFQISDAHRALHIVQEEQLGPQTVAPLPGAPPVELPAIPTEFPPLPDVKLPYIEEVRSKPTTQLNHCDLLNVRLGFARSSWHVCGDGITECQSFPMLSPISCNNCR